jgi:SAM-dependent methyltransferase
MLLHMLEGLAVKSANLGRRTPRLYQKYTNNDLLKAQRIAARLRDGDSVLDIGCGNGHVLDELGLFRRVHRRGIDVAPRGAPAGVTIEAYDGWSVPFADRSFDVTIICYVLHHLSRAHARRILGEALRVTRRRVILLEDSLPHFSWLYRLRNRLHRVSMDIHYRAAASAFDPVGDESMFLTHEGWHALLRTFENAGAIRLEALGALCAYEHHVLIDVARADGDNAGAAAADPSS